MTEQETYAEKIAKLLRKAETTTPAEAELLVAKAQELMLKYAIDADMLAAAQGKQRQDQIVQKEIVYTGIFQAALMQIAFALAEHNDCKGVYRKQDAARHLGIAASHTVTITGFESDVDRVVMLDASLQIQLQRAMLTWWGQEDRSWMSKMDAFKSRRDFIYGFASGLRGQLTTARQHAVKEAAATEAERSGTTTEAATESVALVLKTKTEQVKDWYDNHYGNSIRSVSRRYSSGSAGGRAAGHAAGSRADTGRPNLKGRGQLGRG